MTMLKAICVSGIAVGLAIVFLCVTLIAVELHHRDACDDVFKVFKSAARQPTGC